MSPEPSPVASAPDTFGGVGFDQFRWQQASISIEPNTLLASVGSTPFGWVAAGVRLNMPSARASFAPGSNPFAGLYSGVVWTSPDGRAWTRHADLAAFDGARMTKVLGTGSGALIFGIGGVCMPDACGGLPPNGGTFVWSSPDGETWERLADTGLSEGATTDVTRVDGGFVAVGYVADAGSKPGTAFNEPTDAAVWRSVDGRHWTAVSNLPVADMRIPRVMAT